MYSRILVMKVSVGSTPEIFRHGRVDFIKGSWAWQNVRLGKA